MGRPRLDAEEKKEQGSYRLKGREHTWLIKDGGETPQAEHVANILRRYIKRKIARQKRKAGKK